ncbi:SLATT domain-containing protein [Actinomadura sp. GTD37]|uniref:SLATT domain-containing protein n=1 Tax=Actinomadura sp. GTD37 TaxID=1778030 RepID=UPI0035C03057
MTDGLSDGADIGTQLAEVEESLRQRRFYQRLLGVFLILSLGLTIAFGWIVIAGFKTFPREAQYWCLAVPAFFLLAIAVILKWQQDTIFTIEKDRKRLIALRRTGGVGYTTSLESIRERHRADAWDFLEQERSKAARNRRRHRLSQSIVMLGSILVTALTGAMAPNNPTNWMVVLVSISVAGAAGFGTLFRWRELSFSQQQTANNIEKEYIHSELLIHDYAEEGIDPIRLFAERVEVLKEEQRERELQLEHSPESGSSEHGISGQQASRGAT